MTDFRRTFPITDISVRTEASGRVVEAYAAVFDTPAEVRDQDGHYSEVISRSAFNRTLSQAGGDLSRIVVLFNHGRTLYGMPSDRYAMPIGVPEEIKADGRGLFTRTRFANTDFADEVLTLINDGVVRGYSFQGSIKDSNPKVPRGGFRARGTDLPTVTRTEIALKEYGPGILPVYKEAAIVGVRAEELVPLLNNLDEQERADLIRLLATPAETSAEASASSPDELATGTSQDTTTPHPRLVLSQRTREILAAHRKEK